MVEIIDVIFCLESSEECNFRTVTKSAKMPVLFTPDNDSSPVVVRSQQSCFLFSFYYIC